MAKRMLIDAAHEDEQRIVVLDGSTLVGADFHSTAKAQIKGNIYLARVTRVEPSLQAAFVDFGNDKHGFLPFSEIHPDYFQIPVADREALLESVQEALSRRELNPGGEDKVDDEDRENQAGVISDSPDAKNTGAKESAKDSKKTKKIEESLGDEPLKPKRRGKKTADDKAADKSAGSESDGHADIEIAQPPVSEDKPKPRRRTKKATDQAPLASDEVERDDQAGEEPIKKPRGRPRKKTLAAKIDDDVLYADQEEAPEMEPNPGADDPSKPRNRGRRRSNTRAVSRDAKPQMRPRRRRDEDLDDLSDLDFEARTMTRAILAKKYKIQEVIKRNQVILVQAAKEERGDKGAALTTYLSLPGRYCVLMPNTHRGGGVSRRITNAGDRKRLKSVLDELNIAPSTSLIVRTAGAERTKQEIKRDFAYLSRTWDEIRETTLNSFAPTLVYEEANLIKRAIRDIYESNTQEVLVAGEAAYRAAKAFMKTLTPSHTSRVKLYKSQTPLFQEYGVEGMLESLHQPVVHLPSGGYLVFNQTEALVAVDVNSGKATRERNIEETALRTNLEAAVETAKHLRLRDLAGLIVIDFIDMEENRNVNAVEHALKEALKPDRSRIQVGRISQFGLMELSRQRLRPSVAEVTMTACPTCQGSGYTKSNSGNARSILRQLEQTLNEKGADTVTIWAGADLALVLSNEQRANLSRLETAFNIQIEVAIDSEIGPTHFRYVLHRGGRHEVFGSDKPLTREPKNHERKRGERGNRPGRERDKEEAKASPLAQTESGDEDGDEGDRRRRRRGNRGGRRRGRRDEVNSGEENSVEQESEAKASVTDVSKPGAPQPDVPLAENVDEEAPKPKRRRRKKSEPAPDTQALETQGIAHEDTVQEADQEAAPSLTHRAPTAPEDTPPSNAPKRRGWWSRVRG